MPSRTTLNSEQLFAEAKSLFPGGVNSPVRAFKAVGGNPFVVASGQGPYLFDADNNRYVDFVLSWGPLVLGHAAPVVLEAVRTQLERGTSYGALCELEVKLGELVRSLFPSLERLRFVNSGTEAGMSVVRLARGFTGRSKILKIAGCYHGHVDALLTQAGSGVATLGVPDSRGVPGPVVSDTITVPFNDLSALREVTAQFGSDLAAIILEPVMGNAGFIMPQPNYLPGVRAIADECGALLIFDEVMTGFRVGLGGAQALFDVKPDLTMLGKVVGGGFPVGAFGGRAELMEMLAPEGPIYQAGTLSGNPIAMCAGLATLTEWSRTEAFDVAVQSTDQVVAILLEAARASGIPLQAQSLGTMFGFFFKEEPVRNFSEAQQSDRDRFKGLFWGLLDRGVYIAPSPFEAGFLSCVHDYAALEIFSEAVQSIFSSMR